MNQEDDFFDIKQMASIRNSMRIIPKEESPTTQLFKFFKEPISMRRSSMYSSQTDVPAKILATYGKIYGLYEELNKQLNTLSSNIGSAAEKKSKALLAAFQQKILSLQDELASYKEKIQKYKNLIENDENESKSPFKTVEEALKLSKICERQKIRIEQLEQAHEFAEKDHDFLKQQLKKAKQENRLLKKELDGMEKSSRARTSITGEFTSMMYKNSRNTENGIGNQSKTVMEKSGDSNLFNLAQSPTNIRKSEDFLKTLNLPQEIIANISKFINENSQKYEKTIEMLQNQLKNAKNELHKLKKEQSNLISNKSELEQLFYECVEEKRKQILVQKAQENRKALLLSPTAKLSLSKPINKIQIMEAFMTNEKLLVALYNLIFKNNELVKQNENNNKSVNYEKYTSLAPEVQGQEINLKLRTPENQKRSMTPKVGSAPRIRNSKLMFKSPMKYPININIKLSPFSLHSKNIGKSFAKINTSVKL